MRRGKGRRQGRLPTTRLSDQPGGVLVPKARRDRGDFGFGGVVFKVWLKLGSGDVTHTGECRVLAPDSPNPLTAPHTLTATKLTPQWRPLCSARTPQHFSGSPLLSRHGPPPRVSPATAGWVGALPRGRAQASQEEGACGRGSSQAGAVPTTWGPGPRRLSLPWTGCCQRPGAP